MKKEELIKLAHQYSQNNCSPAERELVESFFQQLQDECSDLPIDLSEQVRNDLYLQISNTLNRSKFKFRNLFYKTAKIAAALVFFITVPAGLLFYGLHSKEHIHQLTAKSEMKTLLLPDGSQVILNANSSISYSEDFKQKRTLQLKGEAFFKVVKNPNSPFVVETPDFKTKVLGTSFNVSAYPNRLNSVSVVTGKVEVISKGQEDRKSVLTKNQYVRFVKEQITPVLMADGDDFNAWTKNILIFQNSTLAETARTLENQFDVSIVFENSTLEHLRISGKFKEESLANILSSIATVKQIEIEFLTKNKIYVRNKSDH